MRGYIREFGQAAKMELEVAWFVIGPEWNYSMMSVRRRDEAEPHVWLDVGDTVRVGGDKTDPNYALFFEVVNVLDGPEAVARCRRAWNMADRLRRTPSRAGR